MGQPDLFPYPKHRLKDMDVDLAASLSDLLEREVRSKRLELREDYDGLLRPALKKVLAEMGLQRMFWPERLGGEGHNKPQTAYTIAAALEQVGRADVGIGFLAAHSLALQASVALEGRVNDDLCAALAPLFVNNGEPVVVSFVLTALSEEDGPTWRGKNLQVKASRSADGLVLEGRGVRPTCSGADADIYGVLCAVEDQDEPAFMIVPGDAEGLERGAGFKKTGLAASRNADIGFQSVVVSGENVAWSGSDNVRQLLSWFHLGLCATCTGALLAAHEIMKEWGDTRVIKGTGHIFKENPLTASLMADAANDTAVCRLLTYDLADILAEPGTFGDSGSEGVFTAASLIAHRVCRLAEDSIGHIMELMASAGYAREWQLERYWRDVKTVQCHIGACELARMDSARWFYGSRTV